MSHFIIIGSGPGGTSAALKILEGGHRVTILERGGFLPKEEDNRSSMAVYGDKKYRTRERWQDHGEGGEFQPWMHYHVGGNAKLYGAALYRFRPADFEEIKYPEGISPAWPVDYAEMAPFYDDAEELYTVHGNREEDPTEPTERPFPFPAVEDEEFVAKLKRDLPIETHSLPLGVSLEKQNEWELRLDKFDAYPDPSLGKSDPESRVLHILRGFGDKFELRTEALVDSFEFTVSGDVRALKLSSGERLTADCYVLAAGAINSAKILLASGLGDENQLIGANYMAHLSSAGIAVFDRPLDLSFAKTFASNEWYRPDEKVPVLNGSIQTQGKWDAVQYGLESWTEKLGEPELLASRAMEFFYMTEDLPLTENRISLENGQTGVSRKLTNLGLHQDLISSFTGALSATPYFRGFSSQMLPIDWCTHQCGTLVYGEDESSSVLDVNCRLRTANNLYVTDSSFFPSSSALNPTLTIVANALRVGGILAGI
ncbi:GMC oxidoreductase [Luteolibacter sp. AS25]|uniref:GMC oxidoreductase n=1 Tax=Luteolibacter sp. AS25 TaxID=3135776 RepID=UPI00398B1A22